VVIYQGDGHLEINGVNGTVENWREASPSATSLTERAPHGRSSLERTHHHGMKKLEHSASGC
jgi:hypothetical protein